MRNYSNVEKSCFHPGEYVAHCNGAKRVTKQGKMWKLEGYAPYFDTLRELNHYCVIEQSRLKSLRHKALRELSEMSEELGFDDETMEEEIPEKPHRRNSPHCSKCGGECQFDHDGNLISSAEEEESQ